MAQFQRAALAGVEARLTAMGTEASAKAVYASQAGCQPRSTKKSTEKAVITPKPTLLKASARPGVSAVAATLSNSVLFRGFAATGVSGATIASVAIGATMVTSEIAAKP